MEDINDDDELDAKIAQLEEEYLILKEGNFLLKRDLACCLRGVLSLEMKAAPVVVVEAETDRSLREVPVEVNGEEGRASSCNGPTLM